MLKIDQLISGYGSVQILNGANMKVEKQSIVALLGGNGTGKSTILRALRIVDLPVPFPPSNATIDCFSTFMFAPFKICTEPYPEIS